MKILGLLIFSIITSALCNSDNEDVTVVVGSNYTLKGPAKGMLSWYCYFGSDTTETELCNLKNGKIQNSKINNYICNGTDLILLNITKSYAGSYTCPGDDADSMIFYKVTVVDPTTPPPPTTTTHTTHTDQTAAEEAAKLALQVQDSSFVGITPTPDQRCPGLLVSGIVGVLSGLAVIIICMFIFACCYRRLYRQKSDPLLNLYV
ncbi:E3 CR1-gamma1 [Simian adenovirus 25]|uniref:E3 CR1-gamma1 n=1 Tax=Simian adenovirus 25 TaxID=175567 RepID=UPI00001D96F8|nr:E3 CR1-gamma1 [Simian adenovirus 25]